MSKSAIYTVNNNQQIVAATGTILTFGMPVRRFGCNIDVSGSGIVLRGQGYYDAEVSVTVAPTVAGAVSIQLYDDGVPVAGASATTTTGAATTPATLTVNALLRNVCCEESVVTVEVVGAAGTVSSVSAVVVKV